MNRIPGMNFLARKRENFYCINKFKSYFPNLTKYFPETFLIPEDLEDYKKAHKNHPKRTYVSKINKGSQGYGITLLGSPKDLSVIPSTKASDMVIQHYIENPLLLEGKKHDLRLYLVISSVEPFIAYLNEEGLARFCTKDYEKPTRANLYDGSIHLTNYSQNKSDKGYVFTNELHEINGGSKRTMSSYWKSVAKNGNDVQKVSLWRLKMKRKGEKSTRKTIKKREIKN